MKSNLKIFGGRILSILFAIFLTACGGSGGGGSSDSGSDTPTPTTPTPTGSLNFKSLDLNNTVSLAKVSLAADGGTGDSGSSMEGFQVKVEKLELKKSDSTYVTVYSGNEYLETVGTAIGTFAGVLSGIMPDAGTYTGLRLTTNAFKIKVKIVSGGTTYYTTSQTVSQGSVWTLSTSLTSYDYITVTQPTSETKTMDFPTQLTVTATNDVNLIWSLEKNGVVSWDGDLPNAVTWAAEEKIVAAFLPSVPSKRVQFTLTASPLSNTITLLLDGSGNLLGGYCHRPTDKAINGNFMKSGSLSAVSNSGNTATFDVSFLNGDDDQSYYQITGDYNCGASTSGPYSSLAVTTTVGAGGGGSSDYWGKGYTLTTAGSVTCGNI